MKNRILHWFVVAVVGLTAVQGSQARRVFDYERDIGIAIATANGSCLNMRNDKMRVGERMKFVNSAAPQAAGELEIIGKGCRFGAEHSPRWHHYQFKLVIGSLAKGAPAFALANFNGELAMTAGGVTADLEANGGRESFRSCTSEEGVHLTIWTGKPLEGPRQWHYYYPLGYDVDANCTAAETNP